MRGSTRIGSTFLSYLRSMAETTILNVNLKIGRAEENDFRILVLVHIQKWLQFEVPI